MAAEMQYRCFPSEHARDLFLALAAFRLTSGQLLHEPLSTCYVTTSLAFRVQKFLVTLSLFSSDVLGDTLQF
jgi:hypothetical protein